MRFSLAFYRRNLVLPPWSLAWNSLYTVENPDLLVCRSNSINNSTTTTTTIIIFTRTVLPCLCFVFLNPAAELMLNMLLNTLLKITPHNTQKRGKRNERTKSRPPRRYFTHSVSNPARQGVQAEGGGGCYPRKGFSEFFLEDKTSAPDVFSSCSSILCAHF